MFISLVVHYVRPKQSVYVRETLQGVIRELVEAGEDIDLEADPSIVSVRRGMVRACISLTAHQIYRTKVDIAETRSGMASEKPKNIPFREALQDPDTRAEYIRRKF